jgi:acyl carrier protein
MTEINIRSVLQEELANIAPEMDLGTIDSQADLRESLDIDSMDFLNFVIAVHNRLGIDIPELDYPRLATLDGAMTYLEAKLAANKR